MEKKHNGVNYGEVVDASLVKERSFKRHHFLQKGRITTNAKTGEMLSPSIVQLDMGVEFIDTWNSYLSFNVRATSLSYEGAKLSSSWLNLIRTVTLTDRNGLEIERLERANLLNNVMLRATFGDDYLRTVGSSLRDFVLTRDVGIIAAGATTDIGETTENGPSKFRRVLVPLSFLLGIFRSANLLPPYLIDGATLRIDWENASEVLDQTLNSSDDVANTIRPFEPLAPTAGQNLGGDFTHLDHATYTIQDLEIVTDNYLLDHSLESVLRKEYQSRGLPIKILAYAHVVQTGGIPLTKNQMTIPIKHSFSRATKLVSQTRIVPPSVLTAAIAGFTLPGKLVYPTFSGQKWIDDTSYYMDMNGVQTPHFPVSEQAVSYWHWLMSFGKNRMYNDSASTLQEDHMKNDAGTTFCVNFNRNMYSFELSSSALHAESTRVVSGVRIDGTSPATLHIIHGSVPTSHIFGNDLEPAYFPTDIKTDIETNSTREMNCWIEHERYVICHPNGNRVVT